MFTVLFDYFIIMLIMIYIIVREQSYTILTLQCLLFYDIIMPLQAKNILKR